MMYTKNKSLNYWKVGYNIGDFKGRSMNASFFVHKLESFNLSGCTYLTNSEKVCDSIKHVNFSLLNGIFMLTVCERPLSNIREADKYHLETSRLSAKPRQSLWNKLTKPFDR